MSAQTAAWSPLIAWTEQNIKAAPEKPGVYALHPTNTFIIGYVGSAGTRGLRARLLEHWNQGTHPKAAYFKWYQTETEKAARDLETQLIKQHNPPWNG
jgi:excinuclease UvrABC nuclease subunit